MSDVIAEIDVYLCFVYTQTILLWILRMKSWKHVWFYSFPHRYTPFVNKITQRVSHFCVYLKLDSQINQINVLNYSCIYTSFIQVKVGLFINLTCMNTV